MSVPCISLAQYERGDLSVADRAALLAACEDHGFFLLTDHDQQAVVDRVFAAAAEFFAQPRVAKLEVVRDADNPLGYFDRELTKQKRDQKEVYDFKAGGYLSQNPARQTRWPSKQPTFRASLTEFFAVFTQLSERTLRMVFDVLGMPTEEIERTVTQGFGELHSSSARLNYYPSADPVPQAERDGVNALGDMALHHHTDPGAITLLLQDDHGGLQANSGKEGWIDVQPIPGSIVVNIGDVMQVWTNDRCTAGMHRVTPIQSDRGRYSVPFFYQPRYDATVSPWVISGEKPHYQPFSWRDFIRGRVSDNFADYGAQDIQIARYRVA